MPAITRRSLRAFQAQVAFVHQFGGVQRSCRIAGERLARQMLEVRIDQFDQPDPGDANPVAAL